MKTDELARERTQGPVGGNVQPVGAVRTTSLSEQDKRTCIENQIREDAVAKTRAGLRAAGSPGTSSPVKPGAYNVTPEVTPSSSASAGSPTRSSPSCSAQLTQMEQDLATKACVRVRNTPSVVMAPGVYQEVDVTGDTASSQVPSGPSELFLLEKDIATKPSVRSSRSTPDVTMAPGAYQVSTSEPLAPPASASGPPEKSDAAIKARGRNPGAISTPSKLSQVEADVTAKTRRTHADAADRAPGAVTQTVPGALAVPGMLATMTNEVRENPLLIKLQESFKLEDSFRLSKDGSTLQKDLDLLENSLKSINAPHGYLGGGRRGSDRINGAGHALDDQENLAVAVAIEEGNNNKFLASAVEYDPDSKPPIYKNRRFRLYSGLLAMVLLGLVIGVVLGLVFGGDDSKTIVVDGDGATSAPTTYRESLGIQEQIEIMVGSDKLYDPSNSQYRALQWILHEDPSALEANDPSLVQRFLLVQFYLETSQKGPWDSCGRAEEGEEPTFCLHKAYNINTPDEIQFIPSNRWLSERDECVWSGVRCNGLSQVTLIDLASQNLTGTLPTELVLLPFLEWIDFPLNHFVGTLPPEWGEMNHLLHIELHSNTLTGTIPDTWWDLNATMIGLNVGNNRLTGTIPGDRLGGMHNMRSLFMDNNFLVGTIPTEVGLLAELRNTRWNNNFFSGSLPTEIGQLKKLKDFWFHRLLLTGTIPSEIAGMVSLIDFRVHSTGLEGNIPDMLYQHSGLLRVDLFSTKIGGTISTEIGNLPRLKTFRVRDCQLYGTIPTEMGLLPKLVEVWLEGNDFTGEIPSEVCDLRVIKNLEILVADCANTKLTGFPAVACESGCCTSCCDTESSICDQY